MAYPTEKEPKVRVEYSIPLNQQLTRKVNPIVIENDSALSLYSDKGVNTSSRNYLNESITFPSRNMFLMQKFNQIKNIYEELNFNNSDIIFTALNIIQSCIIKNVTDLNVSKTGEKELLLFRSKNGEFSNLLIDEDGDVSYIFIGKKKGSEKTEYFPKAKGFDYSKLASLL
jgi:hypothetical protein